MAQGAEAQRVVGSLFGSMQQVPMYQNQSVSFLLASVWVVPTASGLTMSGVGMSGAGFSCRNSNETRRLVDCRR